MVRITSQYFPISHSTAFLNIKQTEVRQVALYLPIFYIHVISTVFVLLAGFTQFSNMLLRNYPGVHRTIGKIYVATLLFLAAPSGFFIGCYANGGLTSKISFVLLSLLWFYVTLKGFTAIRKKKITEHQAFMLRSFALTFSAVTLRFWKVILVYLFQPSPMDVYQIIAWLGWIPNILIVEYYLYRNSKP
ncbi:DUF2306 domain-containing protein [Flavobacterium humi]|uniref:DUF2306 domain-containing protein n=2 Tax=Flavobacterium humi TaxID=2562683 RepID=A0A4Z0LBP7_9FLAO|nr:DUF2306 domain-containing protein [Flavobacterium humi]